MHTCVIKESAWAETVFKELLRLVNEGDIRHIFLPAGSTALPLFARMRSASNSELEQLKDLQWYPLDEVEHKFEAFFRSELPQKLKVNFHPLEAVDVENFDFEKCLCILGVGKNGHVAFHEPDLVDHLFTSACIRLQAISAQSISIAPNSWATTLGLGFFLRAKSLMILLRGVEKQEIWSRMNAGEILPVTRLFKHPDLHVFLSENVIFRP